MMDLVEKLNNRQARVGVIGLGYVGLPLAVAFGESGHDVLGFEVDESKVDSIKEHTYRILEIEQGSWKIENNQLKLYPFEGNTDEAILKFDLLDRDGNPTEGGPFSRMPFYIKPHNMGE